MLQDSLAMKEKKFEALQIVEQKRQQLEEEKARQAELIREQKIAGIEKKESVYKQIFEDIEREHAERAAKHT